MLTVTGTNDSEIAGPKTIDPLARAATVIDGMVPTCQNLRNLNFSIYSLWAVIFVVWLILQQQIFMCNKYRNWRSESQEMGITIEDTNIYSLILQMIVMTTNTLEENLRMNSMRTEDLW
jgi:hypothetical protein